ncbi:hypothetical protein J2T18_003812 [Paenibacillus polymyxa]|nr:hypothetical protein [Paenibacillus polymyxa]
MKYLISYITKQIEVPAELYAQYDWNGRMIKYHRAQIREFFGFRENTVQDSQEMPEWLCQHVLHRSQEWEHIKESVYGRGIMGFNNSALAPLLDLTTINYPVDFQADNAFIIIHNKLNQTKNALNSLEFTLVERKST